MGRRSEEKLFNGSGLFLEVIDMVWSQMDDGHTKWGVY